MADDWQAEREKVSEDPGPKAAGSPEDQTKADAPEWQAADGPAGNIAAPVWTESSQSGLALQESTVAEAERLYPIKAQELETLRAIVPDELEGDVRSRLKEAGVDIDIVAQELTGLVAASKEGEPDWKSLEHWATTLNAVTGTVLAEHGLSSDDITSRFASEVSATVEDGSLWGMGVISQPGIDLFAIRTEPFESPAPGGGPEPVVPSVGPEPVVPSVGPEPVVPSVGPEPVVPSVGSGPVAEAVPTAPGPVAEAEPAVHHGVRFAQPYGITYMTDERAGSVDPSGSIRIMNWLDWVGHAHQAAGVGGAFDVPQGAARLHVTARLSHSWSCSAYALYGYSSSEVIVHLKVLEGSTAHGDDRRSLGRAIAPLMWLTNVSGRADRELSLIVPSPRSGAHLVAAVELECWSGCVGGYSFAGSSGRVSVASIEVRFTQ